METVAVITSLGATVIGSFVPFREIWGDVAGFVVVIDRFVVAARDSWDGKRARMRMTVNSVGVALALTLAINVPLR